LGLQGIIDPPREEAIAAVKACQSAGIQVKMIAGDHALTAAAIAREMGICSAEEQVFTGKQLTQMDKKNLPKQLSKVWYLRELLQNKSCVW